MSTTTRKNVASANELCASYDFPKTAATTDS